MKTMDPIDAKQHGVVQNENSIAQGPDYDQIVDGDEVPLRTYPSRFYGLLSIVLLNIASSFNWLSYAPVPDLSASYYNVSLTAINSFSTVFIATYIVFSWWTGWVFEKYGLRVGLAAGATLQILGAWIRYFGTFAPDPSTKFAVAIFGQILNGIAQPFMLNVPVHYAAIWFSDSGRATATMIGSMANPLGAAIVQIVVPSIVTDESQVSFGLLIVAIVTIVFSATAYFVPSKPPTPPSYSAFVPSEPFIPGLKQISTNLNFLILSFGFGALVGLFNTLSTVLNQIVTPYGYTNDQAGILGAVLVVAGLIGAGVMGPIIDKTKQHVLVIKIMIPITSILLIVFIFVVTFNDYAAIAIICALIGFSMFSLLPPALELGVEYTYPVSESTSAAILWGSGQLFAVILIYAESALKNPDNVGSPPGNMRNALILQAVLMVVTTVLLMFMKKNNKRLDFEQHEREKHQHGQRIQMDSRQV